MTVLMTPEMANFSGKVHGGAVLRLLDQVAYACASRYAGNYVVTLSVDQVTFRQPIAVGELVTFLASVNYTGTSSMEVGVKVVAEDILQGSVCHANNCFFTMMAVDGDGRPTPVPPHRSVASCGRKWSSATWSCSGAPGFRRRARVGRGYAPGASRIRGNAGIARPDAGATTSRPALVITSALPAPAKSPRGGHACWHRA